MANGIFFQMRCQPSCSGKFAYLGIHPSLATRKGATVLLASCHNCSFKLCLLFGPLGPTSRLRRSCFLGLLFFSYFFGFFLGFCLIPPKIKREVSKLCAVFQIDSSWSFWVGLSPENVWWLFSAQNTRIRVVPKAGRCSA